MNVAFIPVRGGSKSIPLKNIKPLCGRPLVYWTVAAACKCGAIDKVYVATDSEQIAAAVNSIKQNREDAVFDKIEVIGRSAESASDTASTESAMLEFAEKYEFDNIVLVQATSPLLMASDLERGFALYERADVDSVLSVVRQKRFNWSVDANGYANALNYDIFHRPRRQEFDGYCVENGAFYITTKKQLLETGNRISGRIAACEMDENTFFEIDEPSDWIIIEGLLAKRLQEEANHVAVNDEKKSETLEVAAGEVIQTGKKKIRMFLTDCDGCLTDGGMYYAETGDEMKKFCAQDGMGFRLLHEKGIICGIITGENVEIVRKRAQKLKLEILKLGVMDKLSVVKELCEEYQVSLEEIVYVGDDINDKEVLEAVGFAASVPNAIASVKEYVDYVATRRGGDGAVREVIDYLLANDRL